MATKTLEDFELSTQDKESYEKFVSSYEQNNQDDNENNSSATFTKGRIIKINENSVMIDIGRKAEANMRIDEIKNSLGEILFKEGDEIDLLVSNAKGHTRVSYKQALKHAKIREVVEKIKDNYQDKIINVEIVGKNKGGFIVKWKEEDVECFLPRQYSAIKIDAKISPKPMKVCIIKADNNGIIVSRKNILI